MKNQILKFSSCFLLLISIYSCSSSLDEELEETGNTIEKITLSTENNLSDFLKGTEVTFKIENEKKKNVTTKYDVYVNNIKITGNSYKLDEVKSYSVFAKKGNIKSPTITVKSIMPTHRTKVLVEDYTATWCGFCPRLAYRMDIAAKRNKDIVLVALHNDDDFKFPGIANLENKFNVQGYPAGRLNRTDDWVDESESSITNLLKVKKHLGLAIKSSLSGNNISVEVKVHYDIKSADENKLIVYVLENGLKADQANYMDDDSSSPFYKKGNPIKNYVHNHTARKALTNVFGDVIPKEKIKTDAVYIKNINAVLPTTIKDNSQLELVAFVVGENNRVINVQKAKVGETKNFD